jgi:hypothetical protein
MANCYHRLASAREKADEFEAEREKVPVHVAGAFQDVF